MNPIIPNKDYPILLFKNFKIPEDHIKEKFINKISEEKGNLGPAGSEALSFRLEFDCENFLFDLYDDFVENVMNINYTNVDPRFHSYRDKKLSLKMSKNSKDKTQRVISTTGQLILNITDKEFVYYTDVNNSQNINYINKLPSNYVPKIRVIIKETEKRVQVKKKAFTRKYLNNLYNKFDYNPLKDKHNKTQNQVL